jgi:hypothetical protein
MSNIYVFPKTTLPKLRFLEMFNTISLLQILIVTKTIVILLSLHSKVADKQGKSGMPTIFFENN